MVRRKKKSGDFSNYQDLDDSSRSRHARSAYWDKGRWDNFILPLLPQDAKDMTFIELGCNAGLFLKMAEQHGFNHVIGVELNSAACERGIKYRDDNGYHYKIINRLIEDGVEDLPLADVVLISTAHYYLQIGDWVKLLDRLAYRCRLCIIVTSEWPEAPERPSGNVSDVRGYFKTWNELGGVFNIFSPNDPAPRPMSSLVFSSRYLIRMDIGKLTIGWKQRKLYWQISEGVDWHNTRYYRWYYKQMSSKGASVEAVDEWVYKRVKLLQELKDEGLKRPILVQMDGIVASGNHRAAALRQLGYTGVLVRII